MRLKEFQHNPALARPTINNVEPFRESHVIAHLESFRANTVDAASAYVAISRAR